MEGFNKILSLFVGLFVVIIIAFLLVRRFGLQTKWPILGAKSVTPTPTNAPQKGAQKMVAVNNTSEALKQKFNANQTQRNAANSYAAKINNGQTAFEAVSNNKPVNNGYTSTDTVVSKGNMPQTNQIPETGLPSAMLPVLFSTLGAGVYLRKKS